MIPYNYDQHNMTYAIRVYCVEMQYLCNCDKRMFAPFKFRTRVCPLRVRLSVH